MEEHREGPSSLLLPRGAQGSRACIGIPFDAGLANRSPVLGKLIEMGSVSELPDGVSFDDFIAWSTLDVEDALATPAADVARALQVAHKLHDTEAAGMATALALKLSRTDWNSEQDKDSMQAIFLTLGLPLQQEVLQHVGCYLHEAYFDMLVATHYNTLFHINPGAADFSRHGTTAGAPNYLHSVLALLSRTTTANATPGLQGLHLHSHHGHRKALACPTTVALLSQALLHHTTLTALSLEGLSARSADAGTPSAATVLLTLPRLKHLTYLSLSFLHMHPADDPEPTPASQSAATLLEVLPDAVAALPYLASFSLTPVLVAGQPHITFFPKYVAAASDESPAHKRRRLASAAPAVSLDPLVAALSSAPSLTSLCLICKGGAQIPCGGLRGPFRPLRHLDLSFVHSHAAAAADAPPTSPLPAAPLQIHTLSLRLADKSSGARSAALAAALEAFSRHAHLARADLQLKAASDASLRCLGIGLRHLAQVTNLYLNVHRDSLHRGREISWHSLQAVAGGLRGMSALTALELSLPVRTLGLPDEAALGAEHTYADGCMYATAAKACAAAATQAGPAICGTSALADLKLTFLSANRPLPSFDTCAIRQFPYSSFAQLTSLRLLCEKWAVPAQYMVAQLPQLTSLERLHLTSLKCDIVQDVEGCLAPLTKLTEVALRAMPVGPALVRCLARCATRMPSLTSMRLTSCDGPRVNCLEHASNGNYAAVDWFEGLLDLPLYGHYTVQCDNVNSCEVRFAEVMLQLADRGPEVSSTFRGHEVKF